jgi:hypothetical protein
MILSGRLGIEAPRREKTVVLKVHDCSLLTGGRLYVGFGRARSWTRLLPAPAEALLPVVHRFNKLLNQIAQALRVLLICY